MKKIHITDITDIESVIRECYSSDKDVVNKFHVVAGQGLDNCVKRTVNDLIMNDVNVYKLLNQDGTLLGYFGEKYGWLVGFFLMPQFRQDHKNVFWNTIKSHLGDKFKIGIFSKNSRAKSFLIKNGCVVDYSLPTEDGLGEILSYKEVI